MPGRRGGRLVRPSPFDVTDSLRDGLSFSPLAGLQRFHAEPLNLSGTANDLSATFAYNPASQIVSTVRTGDNYAWTDHFDVNVTGTANGLNQLIQVGSKSLTHDQRGNVTSFGTRSFTCSSENLLLTGPNSTTLSYDPAMRLYQTVAGGTTVRMAYDGLNRIAEYNGSNALQRRYVFGPGIDQPLVWYEGGGTSDRRFLSSDERGSTISVTDSSGALLRINKYDEYGNPQGTNLGVWGYTGQAWLPGMGGWYYKARIYDRELGRFLQTDPIDVLGGINLHAYVGNDPVNFGDPLGACRDANGRYFAPPTGTRICPDGSTDSSSGSGSTSGSSSSGSNSSGGAYGGGGPLDGAPVGSCTSCIGMSDPASIAHHGGYYAGSTWVSTLSSWSSAIWSWWSHPNRNVLAGSLNPLAVEYGELMADYEAGIITAEEFQAIDSYQGQATATVSSVFVGGAAVGTSGSWLAGRAALSDGFGVFSNRFGTTFFRGTLGSGSWNYGTVRLGWSFNQSAGTLAFQMRVGNTHIPSPFVTPVPPYMW